MKYYLPLPKDVYLRIANKFPDYPNYSAYNYMSGMVSRIKTKQFEAALQAVRESFGAEQAISDYKKRNLFFQMLYVIQR